MTEISDPIIANETKVKIKRPTLYNVIFQNDDFTPMEFVVNVLKEIFMKNDHEAQNIMLEVHQNQFGIAGTYSQEIAQEKMDRTIAIAVQAQHPLQVKISPNT